MWARLMVILFVALCLSAHGDDADLWLELHGSGLYIVAEENQASRRLESLERDFRSAKPEVLAERVNFVMRGLFKIAVMNMRRRGHHEAAKEVEDGWRSMDGELQRIVAQKNRPITDWEPWSKKLAVLYLIIEMKLGYQLAYTLRITDLATFLWTPVVVFDACPYGYQEFFYHFAHDLNGKYRALFPTTAYWLSLIGCSIGTFSMGIVFPICSPISYLIELGADKWLAPKLAGPFYKAQCGDGGPLPLDGN